MDNTGKPIAIHGSGINNGVIPASMINPYGKALLNLIVAQDPVNYSGQPLYNHLSTLPVLPSRIWDDIYKIDYNLSSKHRIAGHLLRITTTIIPMAGSTRSAMSTGRSTTARTASIRLQSTSSASLVRR